MDSCTWERAPCFLICHFFLSHSSSLRPLLSFHPPFLPLSSHPPILPLSSHPLFLISSSLHLLLSSHPPFLLPSSHPPFVPFFFHSSHPLFVSFFSVFNGYPLFTSSVCVLLLSLLAPIWPAQYVHAITQCSVPTHSLYFKLDIVWWFPSQVHQSPGILSWLITLWSRAIHHHLSPLVPVILIANAYLPIL